MATTTQTISAPTTVGANATPVTKAARKAPPRKFAGGTGAAVAPSRKLAGKTAAPDTSDMTSASEARVTSPSVAPAAARDGHGTRLY